MPFIKKNKNRKNRKEDSDGDDDDQRGFNNPNLKFTALFKNKVKNNNYEFIVTIEPENSNFHNDIQNEENDQIDSSSKKSSQIIK